MYPIEDEGNYLHLKMLAEIISYNYNFKQRTGRVYFPAECRQDHWLPAYNLFIRNDPLLRRVELYAGNECYLIHYTTNKAGSSWETRWVKSPQPVAM